MSIRTMIPITVVALSVAFSAASAREQPVTAWKAFDKQAMLQCPALKMDTKPAGDVNGLQEGFYSTLSAKESKAFDNAVPRVDGGPRSCANRDGISCPTAWNMVAMERVGLLPRFVSYACANGVDIR